MMNPATTPAPRFLGFIYFLLAAACHLETARQPASEASRVPHGGHAPIALRPRMSLPGDGTLSFTFEPEQSEPVPGLQIMSADGIRATFQSRQMRYAVPLTKLSRQSVLASWTVDFAGHRKHELQMHQQAAARLIETLSQDPTSRIAIEDRISALRPDLTSAKLFDCRSELDLDTSPDQTAHSLATQMRLNAEDRRRAKIAQFEESSRTRSERKSSLEAEVDRLERAIGGTILQSMGRVTGRAKGGYFVFGVVIPLGDSENIALHEHSVLQGPFYVSGTSLKVLANTVLEPTPVVYQRLTPATNTYGAKLLIPAFSSNLTPRQRGLTAQLESSRSQLSALSQQPSESPPDLSSEDLEVALADALEWRHRWCTGPSTTSAHRPAVLSVEPSSQF